MDNELHQFEAISLEQTSSVSLLNRMDNKYLLNRKRLSELLSLLRDDYDVVEIEGKRVLPYSTIYFDTPDLHYYTMHHNGRMSRLKFRSREYLESGVVFNEVKKKENSGKTNKYRVQREELIPEFDETFRSFAEENTEVADSLIEQLTVTYSRITLVDKDFTERMTIDLDLAFEHSGNSSSFDKLVIVELKREKGNRKSPGRVALRSLRCRETGFSKYCIGVATTRDAVKRNIFKEKLRFVDKLCRA